MEATQTVLQGVRQLLELGWPGIVLILLFMLWRAYDKRVQEHIRDLRLMAGIYDSELDFPRRRAAQVVERPQSVPNIQNPGMIKVAAMKGSPA